MATSQLKCNDTKSKEKDEDVEIIKIEFNKNLENNLSSKNKEKKLKSSVTWKNFVQKTGQKPRQLISFKYCSACQVLFKNLESYTKHLKKKSHLNHQKSMKNSKKKFYDVFRCTVCGINCSSIRCYNEHIHGLRHSQRLKKKGLLSTATVVPVLNLKPNSAKASICSLTLADAEPDEVITENGFTVVRDSSSSTRSIVSGEHRRTDIRRQSSKYDVLSNPNTDSKPVNLHMGHHQSSKSSVHSDDRKMFSDRRMNISTTPAERKASCIEPVSSQPLGTHTSHPEGPTLSSTQIMCEQIFQLYNTQDDDWINGCEKHVSPSKSKYDDASHYSVQFMKQVQLKENLKFELMKRVMVSRLKDDLGLANGNVMNASTGTFTLQDNVKNRDEMFSERFGKKSSEYSVASESCTNSSYNISQSNRDYNSLQSDHNLLQSQTNNLSQCFNYTDSTLNQQLVSTNDCVTDVLPLCDLVPQEHRLSRWDQCSKKANNFCSVGQELAGYQDHSSPANLGKLVIRQPDTLVCHSNEETLLDSQCLKSGVNKKCGKMKSFDCSTVSCGKTGFSKGSVICDTNSRKCKISRVSHSKWDKQHCVDKVSEKTKDQRNRKSKVTRVSHSKWDKQHYVDKVSEKTKEQRNRKSKVTRVSHSRWDKPLCVDKVNEMTKEQKNRKSKVTRVSHSKWDKQHPVDKVSETTIVKEQKNTKMNSNKSKADRKANGYCHSNKDTVDDNLKNKVFQKNKIKSESLSTSEKEVSFDALANAISLFYNEKNPYTPEQIPAIQKAQTVKNTQTISDTRPFIDSEPACCEIEQKYKEKTKTDPEINTAVNTMGLENGKRSHYPEVDRKSESKRNIAENVCFKENETSVIQPKNSVNYFKICVVDEVKQLEECSGNEIAQSIGGSTGKLQEKHINSYGNQLEIKENTDTKLVNPGVPLEKASTDTVTCKLQANKIDELNIIRPSFDNNHPTQKSEETVHHSCMTDENHQDECLDSCNICTLSNVYPSHCDNDNALTDTGQKTVLHSLGTDASTDKSQDKMHAEKCQTDEIQKHILVNLSLEPSHSINLDKTIADNCMTDAGQKHTYSIVNHDKTANDPVCKHQKPNPVIDTSSKSNLVESPAYGERQMLVPARDSSSTTSLNKISSIELMADESQMHVPASFSKDLSSYTNLDKTTADDSVTKEKRNHIHVSIDLSSNTNPNRDDDCQSPIIQKHTLVNCSMDSSSVINMDKTPGECMSDDSLKHVQVTHSADPLCTEYQNKKTCVDDSLSDGCYRLIPTYPSINSSSNRNSDRSLASDESQMQAAVKLGMNPPFNILLDKLSTGGSVCDEGQKHVPVKINKDLSSSIILDRTLVNNSFDDESQVHVPIHLGSDQSSDICFDKKPVEGVMTNQKPVPDDPGIDPPFNINLDTAVNDSVKDKNLKQAPVKSSMDPPVNISPDKTCVLDTMGNEYQKQPLQNLSLNSSSYMNEDRIPADDFMTDDNRKYIVKVAVDPSSNIQDKTNSIYRFMDDYMQNEQQMHVTDKSITYSSLPMEETCSSNYVTNENQTNTSNGICINTPPNINSEKGNDCYSMIDKNGNHMSYSTPEFHTVLSPNREIEQYGTHMTNCPDIDQDETYPLSSINVNNQGLVSDEGNTHASLNKKMDKTQDEFVPDNKKPLFDYLKIQLSPNVNLRNTCNRQSKKKKCQKPITANLLTSPSPHDEITKNVVQIRNEDEYVWYFKHKQLKLSSPPNTGIDEEHDQCMQTFSTDTNAVSFSKPDTGVKESGVYNGVSEESSLFTEGNYITGTQSSDVNVGTPCDVNSSFHTSDHLNEHPIRNTLTANLKSEEKFDSLYNNQTHDDADNVNMTVREICDCSSVKQIHRHVHDNLYPSSQMKLDELYDTKIVSNNDSYELDHKVVSSQLSNASISFLEKDGSKMPLHQKGATLLHYNALKSKETIEKNGSVTVNLNKSLKVPNTDDNSSSRSNVHIYSSESNYNLDKSESNVEDNNKEYNQFNASYKIEEICKKSNSANCSNGNDKVGSLKLSGEQLETAKSSFVESKHTSKIFDNTSCFSNTRLVSSRTNDQISTVNQTTVVPKLVLTTKACKDNHLLECIEEFYKEMEPLLAENIDDAGPAPKDHVSKDQSDLDQIRQIIDDRRESPMKSLKSVEHFKDSHLTTRKTNTDRSFETDPLEKSVHEFYKELEPFLTEESALIEKDCVCPEDVTDSDQPNQTQNDSINISVESSRSLESQMTLYKVIDDEKKVSESSVLVETSTFSLVKDDPLNQSIKEFYEEVKPYLTENTEESVSVDEYHKYHKIDIDEIQMGPFDNSISEENSIKPLESTIILNTSSCEEMETCQKPSYHKSGSQLTTMHETNTDRSVETDPLEKSVYEFYKELEPLLTEQTEELELIEKNGVCPEESSVSGQTNQTQNDSINISVESSRSLESQSINTSVESARSLESQSINTSVESSRSLESQKTLYKVIDDEKNVSESSVLAETSTFSLVKDDPLKQSIKEFYEEVEPYLTENTEESIPVDEDHKCHENSISEESSIKPLKSPIIFNTLFCEEMETCQKPSCHKSGSQLTIVHETNTDRSVETDPLEKSVYEFYKELEPLLTEQTEESGLIGVCPEESSVSSQTNQTQNDSITDISVESSRSLESQKYSTNQVLVTSPKLIADNNSYRQLNINAEMTIPRSNGNDQLERSLTQFYKEVEPLVENAREFISKANDHICPESTNDPSEMRQLESCSNEEASQKSLTFGLSLHQQNSSCLESKTPQEMIVDHTKCNWIDINEKASVSRKVGNKDLERSVNEFYKEVEALENTEETKSVAKDHVYSEINNNDNPVEKCRIDNDCTNAVSSISLEQQQQHSVAQTDPSCQELDTDQKFTAKKVYNLLDVSVSTSFRSNSSLNLIHECYAEDESFVTECVQGSETTDQKHSISEGKDDSTPEKEIPIKDGMNVINRDCSSHNSEGSIGLQSKKCDQNSGHLKFDEQSENTSAKLSKPFGRVNYSQQNSFSTNVENHRDSCEVLTDENIYINNQMHAKTDKIQNLAGIDHNRSQMNDQFQIKQFSMYHYGPPVFDNSESLWCDEVSQLECNIGHHLKNHNCQSTEVHRSKEESCNITEGILPHLQISDNAINVELQVSDRPDYSFNKNDSSCARIEEHIHHHSIDNGYRVSKSQFSTGTDLVNIDLVQAAENKSLISSSLKNEGTSKTDLFSKAEPIKNKSTELSALGMAETSALESVVGVKTSKINESIHKIENSLTKQNVHILCDEKNSVRQNDNGSVEHDNEIKKGEESTSHNVDTNSYCEHSVVSDTEFLKHLPKDFATPLASIYSSTCNEDVSEDTSMTGILNSCTNDFLLVKGKKISSNACVQIEPNDDKFDTNISFSSHAFNQREDKHLTSSQLNVSKACGRKHGSRIFKDSHSVNEKDSKFFWFKSESKDDYVRTGFQMKDSSSDEKMVRSKSQDYISDINTITSKEYQRKFSNSDFSSRSDIRRNVTSLKRISSSKRSSKKSSSSNNSKGRKESKLVNKNNYPPNSKRAFSCSNSRKKQLSQRISSVKSSECSYISRLETQKTASHNKEYRTDDEDQRNDTNSLSCKPVNTRYSQSYVNESGQKGPLTSSPRRAKNSDKNSSSNPFSNIANSNSLSTTSSSLSENEVYEKEKCSPSLQKYLLNFSNQTLDDIQTGHILNERFTDRDDGSKLMSFDSVIATRNKNVNMKNCRPKCKDGALFPSSNKKEGILLNLKTNTKSPLRRDRQMKRKRSLSTSVSSPGSVFVEDELFHKGIKPEKKTDVDYAGTRQDNFNEVLSAEKNSDFKNKSKYVSRVSKTISSPKCDKISFNNETKTERVNVRKNKRKCISQLLSPTTSSSYAETSPVSSPEASSFDNRLSPEFHTVQSPYKAIEQYGTEVARCEDSYYSQMEKFKSGKQSKISKRNLLKSVNKSSQSSYSTDVNSLSDMEAVGLEKISAEQINTEQFSKAIKLMSKALDPTISKDASDALNECNELTNHLPVLKNVSNPQHVTNSNYRKVEFQSSYSKEEADTNILLPVMCHKVEIQPSLFNNVKGESSVGFCHRKLQSPYLSPGAGHSSADLSSKYNGIEIQASLFKQGAMSTGMPLSSRFCEVKFSDQFDEHFQKPMSGKSDEKLVKNILTDKHCLESCVLLEEGTQNNLAENSTNRSTQSKTHSSQILKDKSDCSKRSVSLTRDSMYKNNISAPPEEHLMPCIDGRNFPSISLPFMNEFTTETNENIFPCSDDKQESFSEKTCVQEEEDNFYRNTSHVESLKNYFMKLFEKSYFQESKNARFDEPNSSSPEFRTVLSPCRGIEQYGTQVTSCRLKEVEKSENDLFPDKSYPVDLKQPTEWTDRYSTYRKDLSNKTNNHCQTRAHFRTDQGSRSAAVSERIHDRRVQDRCSGSLKRKLDGNSSGAENNVWCSPKKRVKPEESNKFSKPVELRNEYTTYEKSKEMKSERRSAFTRLKPLSSLNSPVTRASSALYGQNMVCESRTVPVDRRDHDRRVLNNSVVSSKRILDSDSCDSESNFLMPSIMDQDNRKSNKFSKSVVHESKDKKHEIGKGAESIRRSVFTRLKPVSSLESSESYCSTTFSSTDCKAEHAPVSKRNLNKRVQDQCGFSSKGKSDRAYCDSDSKFQSSLTNTQNSEKSNKCLKTVHIKNDKNCMIDEEQFCKRRSVFTRLKPVIRNPVSYRPGANNSGKKQQKYRNSFDSDKKIITYS